MSRGLGTVQRRVMAAAEIAADGRWLTIDDLAATGSSSEVESLRRAVRTLAQRGLLQTNRYQPSKAPSGRWDRGTTIVSSRSVGRPGFRLEPSAEVQAAEAERRPMAERRWEMIRAGLPALAAKVDHDPDHALEFAMFPEVVPIRRFEVRRRDPLNPSDEDRP